jgi:hypothetical protein
VRGGQIDGSEAEAGLFESYLLEGSPRDKLSLARNGGTLHDVSGHNKKSSPWTESAELQRSGGRADQVTIGEFLLTRIACL